MREIIDLHCDTLLECYQNKTGFRNQPGAINLEKLTAGGSLAQCFAAFIPSHEEAEKEHITLAPYELFLEMYAYYQLELEKNKAVILPAKTPKDIRKNAENGMLSAIFTIEDSALLDGKLSRVDEMAEKGVRMMTLTWNYENSLAYPCSDDMGLHQRGLKPFGIEAVCRMNEQGILVDVSHLSEGGVYDVAKHSKKPFVASHSCARALCDHRRNLTDEQLKTIGEAGGVVGINFYSAFLTRESKYTSNDRILEHLRHVVCKAGIEAAAWGSDFDGIDCELEMQDYEGFPHLIQEMSRFFSDDDIEKICSGNFLRVLGE